MTAPETEVAALRQEINELRQSLRTDREPREPPFSRVYGPGWQRVRELVDAYPLAAKLWLRLAEEIAGQTSGAVVASQDTLAEVLGCSVRSIQRATKMLEEKGALVRLRIGSGVYAYAMNPAEVWGSYRTAKEHAAFNTRTLVTRGSANLVAEERIRRLAEAPAAAPENHPSLPFAAE
jgi:biotin operon repressor